MKIPWRNFVWLDDEQNFSHVTRASSVVLVSLESSTSSDEFAFIEQCAYDITSLGVGEGGGVSEEHRGWGWLSFACVSAEMLSFAISTIPDTYLA